MDNYSSNIKVYKGNHKVILLDKQNFNWVRMPENTYQSFIENQKQKENLYHTLKTEYGFFKPGDRVDGSEIKSVYLSITNKCNLQCDFCCVNSGPSENVSNDFTLEDLKNNIIPKLKRLPIKKIVISGGEPSIRKDFKNIVQTLSKEFGKNVLSVQSNGLLLNRDLIQFLAQYVSSIEISIENIFAENRLLDKMDQLFRIITKENIFLALSFVVKNDNKNYLPKAIDLAVKYRTMFSMRIVSPIGRATSQLMGDMFLNIDEMVNLYIDLLDYVINCRYFNETVYGMFLGMPQPKRACGGYGNILSVIQNGETFMCSNLRESKFNLGNILQLSINDMLENVKTKMEQDEIKDLFLCDANDNCKVCDVQYFCAGQCVATKNENNDNYLLDSCYMDRLFLKFYMFYYERDRDDSENLYTLLTYLKAAGV